MGIAGYLHGEDGDGSPAQCGEWDYGAPQWDVAGWLMTFADGSSGVVAIGVMADWSALNRVGTEWCRCGNGM